jgi:hypothetical protein
MRSEKGKPTMPAFVTARRDQKRHTETPLMALHRAWRQLSNEDRARFLIEMLTPAERRLVATGLWPGEEEPPA